MTGVTTYPLVAFHNSYKYVLVTVPAWNNHRFQNTVSIQLKCKTRSLLNDALARRSLTYSPRNLVLESSPYYSDIHTTSLCAKITGSDLNLLVLISQQAHPYSSILVFNVCPVGFEPTTASFQTSYATRLRHGQYSWSRYSNSNRAFQIGSLTC